MSGITYGPPRRFVPMSTRRKLGYMMDVTYTESTGECPVIVDLRKENAMSEPTREQLIQQANLRADYNEAWERGKHWEDWQCRPWNSPNDWRETKCVPFSNAIGYEYRRTPEPPKPIVVAIDGILAANGLLPTELSNRSLKLANFHDWRITEQAELHKGAHATLTLTIYPEGREVSDTVTVPKAVVEEIIRWWKHDMKLGTHGPAAEAIGTLIDAVKGGAE